MNLSYQNKFLSLLIAGVLGMLPSSSIASDEEFESNISCILEKDSSTAAVLDTANDYIQFAVFEGLRKKGGQKWSQEAWGGLYSEFSAEMNAVIQRLRSEESILQMNSIRRHLKTKFSVTELSQVCNVLQDPYFSEFQEKGARSARAVSAVLSAKASGRVISDSEMKDLLMKAQIAERDMQSFISANNGRISRLASSQSFQRWLAVVQEEGQAAAARSNRLMSSSPDLKKVLAKWEARASEGEVEGRKR